MSKSIVSEGKTTAEAIEKGLKAIGLPKELVEIKVIEENKKSFFDILAPKIVKVEIKEKEAIKPEEFEIETTEEELKNAKSRIDRFLKEFVEKDDFLPMDGDKNSSVVLNKGDFLVCYPSDGHRTAVKAKDEPETIKKAIFKVKID